MGFFNRNKNDLPEIQSKGDEVRKRLAENLRGEFQEIGKSNKIENEEQENEYRFQFAYFEVSAKTGKNVEESVKTLAAEIAKEHKIKKTEAKKERDFGTTAVHIEVQNENGERKKDGCCFQ